MYWLLKIIARIPLHVLQLFASWIAVILYHCNSSMKKITSTNIKLVYPNLSKSEQETLIKQSLNSQCLTFMESIKCWGMPPEYALSLVKKSEGEQLLQDALASKKGVIIVITHFGCWELLTAWLSVYTSPVIMYKPNKNKSMDKFMLEARQRINATLVPTDESGVRAIFKHLKKGGLTVILPDHLPRPSGGIYSHFFGQETLCSTLVSKLAHKTQCHVLGLHALRQEQYFHVNCFPLSAEISSPDLAHSVQHLNLDMQTMINQAPEQYMWSYKRFRKIKGQTNIYNAPS